MRHANNSILRSSTILTYLDTLEDDRLAIYTRLTDVQLRSRLEPEKAIFIAESTEVIVRALDAGLQPLSILTAQEYLAGLAPVLESIEHDHPDVPVYIAPEKEIQTLTGFELTRGALAAFRRPVERTVEEVTKGASLIAVLEDIRNHTNVGAIFRSAAALGVDAVLVSPACYDPLYRRAIRVSMGTVFQIPWARIGTNPHSWALEGLPLLKSLGFTTAAMALCDNSIPLDDPCLKTCGPLALIFGTEGDGLSHTTLSTCDYTVRIPMKHGVDSLNVAASSAVAFWELRKR